MKFVREEGNIRTKTKHVRPLTKAGRKTLHSTKEGKLQVTGRNNPLYVSALEVPRFKDNMISVG